MTERTPRRPAASPRSAARLAAVQALYGWELGGASVESLLDGVLNQGLVAKTLVAAEDDSEAEIEARLVDPDPLLLAALLKGAVGASAELDAVATAALAEEWPMDRLEAVLRAVLRAGTYELRDMQDTPARVVITEYVDIARAFYSGPEPKLVNAVLDRIARVLRQGEFGGDAPLR